MTDGMYIEHIVIALWSIVHSTGTCKLLSKVIWLFITLFFIKLAHMLFAPKYFNCNILKEKIKEKKKSVFFQT